MCVLGSCVSVSQGVMSVEEVMWRYVCVDVYALFRATCRVG